MNKDELPEDSDSSDEDYVPDGKAEEAVSEVDSDGSPEEPLSGSEGETNTKSRKRTKKVVRGPKKAKVTKNDDDNKDQNEVIQSEQSEDDKKKKADDLWADFMKDTGFKTKNSKPETSSIKTKNPPNNTVTTEVITKKEDHNLPQKQQSKVRVTQIFEFAGEEVKVEKEVDSNSAEARLLSTTAPECSKPKKSGGLGGIGSVLTQLGKKQKISTLEKSKLDWETFKKEENIEAELETFNKGKDGYLERQDFLQRADLRRFEIEKEIRNVERAKRFNSAV